MRLISVVIPAFNAGGFITDALDSLSLQTYPYFEVIVVDDHSEDETASLMRQVMDVYPYPLRLQSNKRNMGPGFTRNKGVDIASHDYIALLDADAVPPPDWLEKAMPLFDEADVFGGRYLASPKNLFGRAVYAIENFADEKVVYQRGQEPHIAGTNMFFKREVFEKLCGFSPKLRAGEDRLLLRQAIENGFRVLYDPQLVVHHGVKENLRAYVRQENSFRKWSRFSHHLLPRRKFQYLSIFLPTMSILALVGNLYVPYLTCILLSFCLVFLFLCRVFMFMRKKRQTFLVSLIAATITILNNIITLKVHLLRQKPSLKYWRIEPIRRPYHIVLYDEGTRTGKPGGGQIGRLELFSYLQGQGGLFSPILLTSRNSEFADVARQYGLKVFVEPLNTQTYRINRYEIRYDLYHLLKYVSLLGRSTAKLVKWLHQRQVDLLFPNDNYSRLIGGFAAILTRTPVIMVCSDELTKGLIDRLLRMYYLLVFDRIIAPSDFIRNTFKIFGRLPPKVIHINPGVDLNRFRPGVRGDLRDTYSIPKKVPLVAIVGHLIPVKGHKYFLETLHLGHEKFEPYCLIVGTGPEEGNLRKMVSQLGLSNRVLFLGHRNDIPEILSACDALVSPSLSEANPRVVREAMAMGLPVIATAVGGQTEMIEEKETGFLVPARDSYAMFRTLVKAFTMYDLSAMGRAARKRAEILFPLQKGLELQKQVLEESLKKMV